MKPAAQRLLGIVLVAAAALALLARTGVLDIDLGDLVRVWWPLGIVVVGVVGLMTTPRAWVGPSVLILVGAILLANRLGYLDASMWELVLPIVLLVAGIGLISGGVASASPDPDVLSSTVVWWGSAPRTRSQTFRAGSFTAVMGGIDVDLRQAGIVGRAEISVFTFWGGVDIKVPPSWRVTVRGLPLLGGWDDKTVEPLDPDAPELVVHVTTIMAGVDVRN